LVVPSFVKTLKLGAAGYVFILTVALDDEVKSSLVGIGNYK
jgi:hypothetical protein